MIASGPTVADPSSSADALAVLEKYDINPPAAIVERLRSCADETPKPGDQRLSHARFTLVATPANALEAAAALARARGYRAVVLGDAVEGEARVVAREHAEIALRTDGPSVLVSGGETWVRVRGGGRGGRNAEYLLALALALEGRAGVHAIACDTDGIDGTEANAGCVIGPETLARGWWSAQGIERLLARPRDHAYRLYSLLMLELAVRVHIEGAHSSTPPSEPLEAFADAA